LLVLRELFQLPYRQSEGLGKSLVERMEIELAIPDYTSLAKRAAKMDVSLDIAKHRGRIDVVVDSTGPKVFGEGEWKMRKHGKSKRRTWRKLHLAVNLDTHEIEAETLTENSCDDASQVDDLLDQATNKVVLCHIHKLGLPRRGQMRKMSDNQGGLSQCRRSTSFA
jgi:hypothetical protein